ncbi:MAG: ribosomal protein S18-alanine N-acetyltransferase [Bacillota bacterium]
MNFTIEVMTEEDLPAVMEIERDSFPHPWSSYAFKRDINNNPYSLYLMAVGDNGIIGYIGCWFMERGMHITNLAVARDFRQQGVATTLIREIEQLALLTSASSLSLEVRRSNYKAINLYQKLGFHIDDYFPGYYHDNNEDALIMRKELTE